MEVPHIIAAPDGEPTANQKPVLSWTA